MPHPFRSTAIVACLLLPAFLLAMPVQSRASGPKHRRAKARRMRLHAIPKPVPKALRHARAALAPKSQPKSEPEASVSPYGTAPDVVAATPVGVTEDQFSLSPLQLRTPHGFLGFVKARWLSKWLPRLSTQDDGVALIHIEESFWRGHDVVVDCWGRFPETMTLAMSGTIDGEWRYFGEIQISGDVAERPLKVVVPTKFLGSVPDLAVEIYDADFKGAVWRLSSCAIQRI